jgi:uncharacterized delta-60 repeat protein
MKKFTSTLFILFACLYLTAQPGTLDASFNTSGTPGYRITDIDGINNITTGMVAKGADGSTYVTGYNSSTDDLFIVHYLANGTVDGSFGTGGIVKYRYSNSTTRAFAIGLQSTGAVVVAGWSYPNSNHDFFVGRFDGTTGALLSATTTAVSQVTNISGQDEVSGLAIQSDDKIVVVGFATGGTGTTPTNDDMVVARYTAAGALDNTFNNPTGYIVQNINTQDYAQAVAIDKTSGDIIVAGTSNSGNALSNFAILRLTSAGAFNTSFDGDGILIQDINAGSQDEATAVAIQNDGKILVAGTTQSSNPKNAAVIRISAAGVLDGGFNTTGIAITNYAAFNSNEEVNAVAIQNDNKIVVGGGTDGSGSGTFDFMLLRYTSAGSLDPTFGAGFNGKASASVSANINDAAMQLYSTRIYTAGSTQSNPDVVIAAFINDATPLPLVLSQFYALKQTSKVVLQWQTTSEEDVKHFVIERSSDGKAYKAIGQVAAAGNSTTKKDYMFADQSPFVPANNYYRLVMVDADGNYKYSKILIVKFDGQVTTNMQLFPTNVKDVLQIQLPSGLNGNVNLRIIDMNGRVVKRNNLASDGSAVSTTMDVSSLVSGVYVLKAQAGNTSVISRFTKN